MFPKLCNLFTTVSHAAESDYSTQDLTCGGAKNEFHRRIESMHVFIAHFFFYIILYVSSEL